MGEWLSMLRRMAPGELLDDDEQLALLPACWPLADRLLTEA